MLYNCKKASIQGHDVIHETDTSKTSIYEQVKRKKQKTNPTKNSKYFLKILRNTRFNLVLEEYFLIYMSNSNQCELFDHYVLSTLKC